ncbi:f936efc8-25fd-43c0-9215-a0ada360ce9d-CDS [Sclerotinia trifoliorum]|uniref:F936efc8-25fd-43c0-9215-a0ada360ce9d-CDS n=1 Tax=Sclerotinia trifoliorum TaxID=28548 RepID=A0A8H2W2H1_9HELO|nr:f936efc8-25fd-43c0-9215-a0ada360ce9d-CDS [Sclerotinia trifoliorum]
MCHGGFYESSKDMGPSWLVNECEHVKSIHDRFRDNIAQGENLPPEYDKALGALEILVVNEVNRRADLLGQKTSQRPGFSHKYIITQRSQDQGPDILETRRKGGLCSHEKYLFENDILDYCLFDLRARPDRQANPDPKEKILPLDHALAFSLIENHLAKSSFKEKSRIDEVLSSDLSDLAACHEMLVAIRLHRPRNHARTLDEECSKLGKTLFKDFYEVQLPSNRKDMAWFDHTKSSRRALEAFWQGMRNDCATVWKRNGFTEDEVADELDYISATETQEYLDTIQAEDLKLLAQTERNQIKKNQANHAKESFTSHNPPTNDLGPRNLAINSHTRNNKIKVKRKNKTNYPTNQPL